MAAKLLDGKRLAEEIRVGLGPRVLALAERGVVPGLAVLLVGDDPASVSYVTAKEKACAELGMRSVERRLPAEAGEAAIIEVVREFNDDPSVHGILIQLPLPKGVSEAKVVEAISPEKDVDGFTPVNVGRMVIGEPCFLPCTPHGVLKLIEVSGIRTAGAHAVVAPK
ncbi:MAG TPA: tetrahydrofolate dehydrogenase/cyclohydrolase catalytic domain-containing protein, partial [Spirochaetales bacterium]|nr:tetrahydrofolate dehydrogenase/cyclohydrolase catalytic domain-containing protein [Spirochaetales bacterium]